MNIKYFIKSYEVINNIEYNKKIIEKDGILILFELNNWKNGWKAEEYRLFIQYCKRYLLNFISPTYHLYKYIFDLFPLINAHYYLCCQYYRDYKNEYYVYLHKQDIYNTCVAQDINIGTFRLNKLLNYTSDEYIISYRYELYSYLYEIEKKINAQVLLEKLKID